MGAAGPARALPQAAAENHCDGRPEAPSSTVRGSTLAGPPALARRPSSHLQPVALGQEPPPTEEFRKGQKEMPHV